MGFGNSIWKRAIICTLMVFGASCGQSVEEDTNITDDTEIVGLIINHEELERYFHPEVMGRMPLIIATNRLLSLDIGLEKFNRSVEFVESGDTKPHIEFTRFEKQKNTVNFKLVYDVEGVSMMGMAVKELGRWRLQTVELAEG